MLRHVVMWRVKESALGLDRPSLIAEFRRRLEALPALIPAIRGFEVGVNQIPAETASDLALVSSFDDLAGLQAYLDHPAHQELVAFVRQVVSDRRVADYEVRA